MLLRLSAMKKSHIIIIAAVVLVAVIVAIVLGVVLTRKKKDDKGSVSPKPHPENEAYAYEKAAVATDAPICSKV